MTDTPYRFNYINACDRLLVLGTTLATYSSFRSVFHWNRIDFPGDTQTPDRLLKHALSLSKPVLMVNVGPTRVDAIASAAALGDHGIEKIELPVGDVVKEAAKDLL